MESMRRHIPRPTPIVIAALSVGIAVLFFWRFSAGVGSDFTSVTTEAVERRVVQESVLAPASLVFKRTASLRSEVLAKVVSIEVKEGDEVKEGAVLLRLDAQTLTAVLAREEAGLRQNQINIDRQRNLVALRKQTLTRSVTLLQSRLINQSRVDEDRSQLSLAEADLRSAEQALERAVASVAEAREQLGKTVIRAPFDGKVISIPIAVGEIAVPTMSSIAGASLAKIVDTSSLQAKAAIDERDVGRIALGQRAEVFVASNQTTPLQAKVTDIAFEVSQSRTLGTSTNSIEVTLDVTPDPAVVIRAGISARASIFTGSSEQQLSVPVQAVVVRPRSRTVNDFFVWVVQNGLAKRRSVVISGSDSRYQAIKSGVEKGEQVIVGPARTLDRLQEGQRVRPSATLSEAI
jgi:HlyD family secretion protein